jgi:ATP-dependent Clp protease ATP-binding subunit ClpA
VIGLQDERRFGSGFVYEPVLISDESAPPEPEAPEDPHQNESRSSRDIEAAFIDPNTLFDILRERVIGQDVALTKLANIVSRHLAKSNPRGPASVFLSGSTGIGKTWCAEMLGESLQELNLDVGYLRLDMNQYSEPHRVSSLLGAPPGYVGHGSGSELINRIQEYPLSVIVFDEIEKAHPDILKVLMNAIDEGRLADSYHGEISCSRSIFIFTSNTAFQATNGSAAGDVRSQQIFNNACRAHLFSNGIAPEIGARIQQFISFNTLENQHREEILRVVVSAVAEEYGLRIVHLDDEFLSVAAEEVELEYGVRAARALVDGVLGEKFRHHLSTDSGITEIRIEAIENENPNEFLDSIESLYRFEVFPQT